jgi:hypothetical protein
MLYQLSYASILERETGIGPATNSLEGCDSTTELLPRRKPLYQETRPTATPRSHAGQIFPSPLFSVDCHLFRRRVPPSAGHPGANLGLEEQIRAPSRQIPETGVLSAFIGVHRRPIWLSISLNRTMSLPMPIILKTAVIPLIQNALQELSSLRPEMLHANILYHRAHSAYSAQAGARVKTDSGNGRCCISRLSQERAQSTRLDAAPCNQTQHNPHNCDGPEPPRTQSGITIRTQTDPLFSTNPTGASNLSTGPEQAAVP